MAKRPRNARKGSTPKASSEPNSLPEWAVHIYMRPDQALEAFAERDIQEMVAGVTGPAVRAVVHLEQERDVRRILITDGVATEIPNTDWKDPRYPNRPTQTKSSVESFLTWAQSRYPGNQRLVVLWGHSRGVGIDFLGPSGLAVDVPETATSGVPSPVGPSPDGLSIPDLIDAITPAASGAGRVEAKDRRPIDVLGLDSCYMSSVEIARELESRVAFLVAADGAVKRTGWNYRFVLGALSAAKPPLSPDALARTIVDHVATLEGDVSLARLDLDKSEAMEGAFEELVAKLQAVLGDPDEAEALFIMLKRTCYLQVRQFLDLRDLCHQMRAGFGGEVAAAADKVLLAYGAMVYSRAIGMAAGRLNGVSVYCPLFRARDPFGGDLPDVDAIVEEGRYEKLKFVSSTKWLALCDGLKARLAFGNR